MKKLTVFAALTACVLSSSAWSGTYTVGVEATDYMPISKGDDGKYSGYARELLDAFASKNGHKFTYTPLPIARLIDEFAVKKSLDFKFPDNGYWAKEVKKDAKIVYSQSAVTVIEGLMVLPANKGKGVDSIKKLGTVRGFTPWPYMDQIKSNKIVVSEANTPEAVINMCEAGRIDAVYGSVIVSNYIMTDMLKKPGILVFDDKLPSTKSDFSLASIAHPDVIKQFDEFLAKDKDTVAKLKAKYKIVE